MKAPFDCIAGQRHVLRGRNVCERCGRSLFEVCMSRSPNRDYGRKTRRDHMEKMFTEPLKEFVPLQDRHIPDDPLALAKALKDNIERSVPGNYALKLADKLIELLSTPGSGGG
jgi:hypothetical protein